MKSYLNLLNFIMEHGEDHEDRTGVGTISVFGAQLRHSMAMGFPLLTTKRVFFRGVAEELFWFLSGSTDEHALNAHGVKIWEEWANSEGELGPIYGKQFRHQSTMRLVEKKHIQKPAVQNIPIPPGMENSESYQRSFLGVACMGAIMGKPGGQRHPLLETWKGMIQRCYSPKHEAYNRYGGRDVWVCDDWLVFSNFVRDFEKIRNWELKAEFPNDYSLDKDVSGTNLYSPETCAWKTAREQTINTEDFEVYRGVSPDGKEEIFESAARFAKERGLIKQCILNCVRGRQSLHKGWKFERIPVPEGYSLIYEEVDQIKQLYAQIQQTPNSRRIVCSAWNPLETGYMSLAPCHTLFQVKVHSDNALSLHLYMRSTDVFLGLPFNIASYALLLSLLAHTTGRAVKDLIISFGDLHIYKNHIEQARMQLTREPRHLPELGISKRLDGAGFDGLLSCKFEDLSLRNYDPHPKIEAEVAV